MHPSSRSSRASKYPLGKHCADQNKPQPVIQVDPSTANALPGSARQGKATFGFARCAPGSARPAQRSPTALPKHLFILFRSLTLPFGKLQATGIFPSGVPDSCDEHGKAWKYSQALESKDSLGKDLFSVRRIKSRLSTCRNQDCYSMRVLRAIKKNIRDYRCSVFFGSCAPFSTKFRTVFASRRRQIYVMVVSTKLRAQHAALTLAEKVPLCSVLTVRQQVPVPSSYKLCLRSL